MDSTKTLANPVSLPSKNNIYKNDTTWVAHELIRKTRTTSHINKRGHAAQLPAQTVPVTDLKDEGDRWTCNTPAHLNTPPQNTPQRHTMFKEYCNNLPLWHKHLLANINFLKDEEELCYLLQANKMLYLVTDGGKTAGIGYYGW
eukprot:9252055-Ditylum_brightwellii.AAC.1